MGGNRKQKRICLIALLLPSLCWGEWRESQPVSWDLHDLVFVDNTGWAVGDNGILKTGNFGNSWTVYEDVGGSAIWFWDEQRGLLTGSSSGLWRTQDGGSTWNEISSSIPFEQPTISFHQSPRRLFFHDDNRGWLLLLGSLWRTFDGGESWEESTLELPEDAERHTRTEMNHSCCYNHSLRDMYFLNEHEGYVVGGYRVQEGMGDKIDRGLIYETLDGGETWNRTSSRFQSYSGSSQSLKYILGGVFGASGIAWLVGSGEMVITRQTDDEKERSGKE